MSGKGAWKDIKFMLLTVVVYSNVLEGQIRGVADGTWHFIPYLIPFNDLGLRPVSSKVSFSDNVFMDFIVTNPLVASR